jgi:hypothetical protein
MKLALYIGGLLLLSAIAALMCDLRIVERNAERVKGFCAAVRVGDSPANYVARARAAGLNSTIANEDLVVDSSARSLWLPGAAICQLHGRGGRVVEAEFFED